MTSATEYGRIPEIGLPQRGYLARDMADMAQAELADAMGVSRRTIVNVENGDGNPRRPTLAAWALATGAPMEWLETGKTPAGGGPGGGNEYATGDSNPEPADSAKVLLFSRTTIERPGPSIRKLVAA